MNSMVCRSSSRSSKRSSGRKCGSQNRPLLTLRSLVLTTPPNWPPPALTSTSSTLKTWPSMRTAMPSRSSDAMTTAAPRNAFVGKILLPQRAAGGDFANRKQSCRQPGAALYPSVGGMVELRGPSPFPGLPVPPEPDPGIGPGRDPEPSPEPEPGTGPDVFPEPGPNGGTDL